MAMTSSFRMTINPNMAWLLLFLPALAYYMSTRLTSLGLFSSSSFGQVIETSFVVDDNMMLQCPLIAASKLLYTNHDCTSLTRPVYMVHDGFESIVATTWKHDEELGRGYLLVSTSAKSGMIWQWETGGGPIPIGRTLNLKDSGCRSNLKVNCTSSTSTSTSTSTSSSYGSGGIIVDTWHEPPRLLVAEWGEGRIARLEDNGVRTPLLMHYSSSDGEPLLQPFQLLLTPFGDLLVLDRFVRGDDTSSMLWKVPQVHKIPALPSLAVSREAHAWTSLNTTTTKAPEILLRSNGIGGMALEPNNWLKMYVTMRQNDRVVVVSLSLDFDDDDDDDNDDDAEEEQESRKLQRQSAIVLDYTKYASQPGAMEVDEKGNLYLVVDGGVLLVSPPGNLMGKIAVPNATLVDLTLGEDKFLYMSTSSKLYRMRVRNGPLKVPTDLLLKR
jgi:sugar lactone lactonase YvrE